MSSTSFSIKDDLEIAYWAEPNGVFILGQSELGDPDLLAVSNKSWISLTNYVNNVEIENGTQVEQGVLNYPKAGTCNVSMQGNGLSTFVNKSLRAGSFISVGLRPTDAIADRRNKISNPKPDVNSGTNTQWLVTIRGSGGSSTSTVTGGYWVDTVTALPGNNTYTWSIGWSGDVVYQTSAVNPNTSYTASVYATSSIADYRAIYIRWYTAAGVFISSSGTGVGVSLPANTETRLSVTGTSPATANFAIITIDVSASGGSSVVRTVGSTMKMRKAFLDEGATTVRDYFDGDSPYDFRYGAFWETGVANNGASTLTFQQPTLFVGRIKTVDTIYPLEGPAQVNVTATDFLEDFLAYNVANYDIPTATGLTAPFNAYQTIKTAFDAYYGSAVIDDSSTYIFATNSVPLSANMQDLSDPVVLGTDNVSVSNIVNSALDCELGMITMDYHNNFDGTSFISVVGLHPRNSVYGTYADIPYLFHRNFYTVGNVNSPDAYINDIQLYSSTNELANKVIASLAWDSAVTVTDKDQDAIDLYGELSTERSLNLWNLFALNLWAKALNEYSPVKYVRSVAGITATPGQPISALAFMKAADLVTVNFNHNDLVLSEPYRIVNVIHTISPDEWHTTVELWKGN